MKRDRRVRRQLPVAIRSFALLSLCLGVGLMSSGCSAAASSVAPSSAAPGVPSPTATSAGSGMKITGAVAMPVASKSNALTVVATIRNETASEERLVGASAPGAKRGALYATCACIPAPVDPETGLVGKSTMPWWKVGPGETVSLRPGDGELILTGLPDPILPGQTIEVTFQFASGLGVKVDVPVVASID